MRDPKERESEHILDVVHIELLPIDNYGSWEESLKRNASKLPKIDKKYSFFHGSGLEYLEDDEHKAIFGFSNRSKHLKHRHFIEEDALKTMKTEIIAETIEVITKFKEELDKNFVDFKINMSRELAKRQKHQLKKIEKLLKQQKNSTPKQTATNVFMPHKLEGLEDSPINPS